MADCHTKILRVSFDISDDDITHVEVEIDYWGDCPDAFMKRVYRKSFPARMSMVDILQAKDGITDYLMWD